nr:hypothetical protein Iba_chr13dCG10040 [Ipomoea batatas]
MMIFGDEDMWQKDFLGVAGASSPRLKLISRHACRHSDARSPLATSSGDDVGDWSSGDGRFSSTTFRPPALQPYPRPSNIVKQAAVAGAWSISQRSVKEATINVNSSSTKRRPVQRPLVLLDCRRPSPCILLRSPFLYRNFSPLQSFTVRFMELQRESWCQSLSSIGCMWRQNAKAKEVRAIDELRGFRPHPPSVLIGMLLIGDIFVYFYSFLQGTSKSRVRTHHEKSTRLRTLKPEPIAAFL